MSAAARDSADYYEESKQRHIQQLQTSASTTCHPTGALFLAHAHLTGALLRQLLR
jgi:hypothetical protein